MNAPRWSVISAVWVGLLGVVGAFFVAECSASATFTPERQKHTLSDYVSGKPNLSTYRFLADVYWTKRGLPELTPLTFHWCSERTATPGDFCSREVLPDPILAAAEMPSPWAEADEVWLNQDDWRELLYYERCRLVLHEVGHTRGMHHTIDPLNIMYPVMDTVRVPRVCKLRQRYLGVPLW